MGLIKNICYKKTPQTDLHMALFQGKEQGQGACVVWFICGGWQGFDQKKFFPQAEYLSQRGLTVFVVQVRSVTLHGTHPKECIIDAKSAIRAIRKKHNEFGIHPEKVIAAGGSASGHVSLCTYLDDSLQDSADEVTISCQPNFLCLFNPVVNTLESDKRIALFGQEAAEKYCPIRMLAHVKTLPPTLIMQGDHDEITSLEYCQEFMSCAKNEGLESIYPS